MSSQGGTRVAEVVEVVEVEVVEVEVVEVEVVEGPLAQ